MINEEYFNVVCSEKIISITEKYSLRIIYCNSFGGFGLKLLKAKGLENFLRGRYKSISLFGNLHSNFLSAFTWYFYNLGYKVKTFSYSYNTNKSYNSIITEKHSENFSIYNSRKDCFEAFENSVKEKKFLIPEFGIHKSASDSLRILWDIIVKKLFHVKHLFLEIGSGLTISSLLYYLRKEGGVGLKDRNESGKISNSNIIKGNHFTSIPIENLFGKIIFSINQNSEIVRYGDYKKENEFGGARPFPEIHGICIGRRANRMKDELEKLYYDLYKDNLNYENLIYQDPLIISKFGKSNDRLTQFINDNSKKGVLLEPVYSGKTVFTISELAKQNNWEGEGLYIHQGGMGNFLSLFA
ncbi:MAG: hypothetical protein KDK36_07500 [Leptospiraceae bacterium]|nr:hypothetical protein [Leptospiraceae bacterium]